MARTSPPTTDNTNKKNNGSPANKVPKSPNFMKIIKPKQRILLGKLKCPICSEYLERVTTVVTKSCGHVCCKTCLLNSTSNTRNRKLRCPLCQKGVNKKTGYQQLYLEINYPGND